MPKESKYRIVLSRSRSMVGWRNACATCGLHCSVRFIQHTTMTTWTTSNKQKILGRFDWIFMLIEHTGYTENRHWKRQWSKYIGKILPSHTMARTQSHDDVDNSQIFQNTLPLSAISIPCDSCDNDDALVYVLGACKAMPISFSKAFRLAHSVPVHQMHSLIVFDYS